MNRNRIGRAGILVFSGDIGKQADHLALGVEHRAAAVATAGGVDAHLKSIARLSLDGEIALLPELVAEHRDDAFVDRGIRNDFRTRADSGVFYRDEPNLGLR